MTDSGSAPEQISRILRDWQEIPLLQAVLVLLLGFALIAAIKRLFPRIADALPDRFRFYIRPWEPILRFFVLLFLFVYVTPMFIVPSTENLLAIAGAAAVALGFAFKDYVSSLIAGVVALYERPYRSGDWVRIGDTYGEVRSHDLRTVRLLTPDDTMVSIPHGMIWTAAIHNANSGQRDLMCVADFFLHPDHDGRLVRRALEDVALSSPYLQTERPVAVVAAEKPWGTHYRLKAYPIDGRDQFQFLTDLTLRGKALLRRHGIRFVVAPAAAPAAG